MGVQVLSYDLLKNLNSKEKVEKILDIVKKKDIVMIEGRLLPEEETILISSALESISGKFTGIEVAFLDSNSSSGIFEKLATSILKMLAKNRFGITVVGPSKIVKEIKMDPKKLEILFN